MIEVDISGVWGNLSLTNLLEIEQEVFSAHMALTEGACPGWEKRGWMDLPLRNPTEEILRLQKAAKKIRMESDVCLVVGIGAGMGARGVIEMLQGRDRNLGKQMGDPMVLFTGDNFSTRVWNELMGLLEERDYSLIVTAPAEMPLETALAFRALRWKLERKYGSDEAADRIYVVTDPEKGALHEMAEIGGWEQFSLPENVPEICSLLTPAGLLPMAVAGVDILEILNGAMDAKKNYDVRSLENPVWLYSALRTLLHRGEQQMELLCSFEAGLSGFFRWWQQLFAACGRGPVSMAVELTADTHFLGHSILGKGAHLFETVLRFDPPARQNIIGLDWRDIDRLNDLEGKPMEYVEEMAWQGMLSACTDGGVPVLSIPCGRLKERTAGELVWFAQLAAALCAGMEGVEPFQSPARQESRRNLMTLLGRSGEENAG